MNFPKISVIAPVFNDEDKIALLIESLLRQDYPKDRYEIIIIDNNSSDQTREVIRRYPVILLEERSVQSSYAARNLGIARAQHGILAFIDSDCIAAPDWLKEGAAALSNADLAGGLVEFYFSGNATGAEYFDSLIHFQFHDTIRERKVTGAGNLFVHRSVFDAIGTFPGSVKSGGDFLWTGKATANGFNLVYAPKAIVQHPARTFGPLLKKQFRTGAGKPHIWKANGEPLWNLKLYLTLLLPPKRSYVRGLIMSRGRSEMNKKFWHIWFVCYFCKLHFLRGILSETLWIPFLK